MHPGATRVGPSIEPSVRKSIVRLSSGATIWIEKAIKVESLSALCAMEKRSSSQEAGQQTK
jgi:hypothetical protein